MTDITYCANDSCPLRGCCRRALFPKHSPHSYTRFEWKTNRDTGMVYCDDGLLNTDDDRFKPKKRKSKIDKLMEKMGYEID